MFSRFIARLTGLARRRRAETEVDEAIRLRLEMETPANVTPGVPPGEARRRAFLAPGGVGQTRDSVRDDRTRWLDSLRQDFHGALRTFSRRDRALALTAVVTLALGIGAATAMFAAADGMLFRPLPFPDAHRLMTLSRVRAGDNGRMALSRPLVTEIREQCSAFDSVAAFRMGAPVVPADGRERLVAADATASLLRILGAPMALGRAFSEADEQENAMPVAVISHALWLRHYGGSPSVIGQSLVQAGAADAPVTIVGVLAADFTFPYPRRTTDIDAWLPLRGDMAGSNPERSFNLVAFGRLRPGATGHTAQAQLDTVATRLAASRPDLHAGYLFRAIRWSDDVAGKLRTPLLLFLAGVGALLLLACANVANLLLARGVVRRREFAVRAALGAGRWRLAQQLLVESVTLATVGGVLGVGVAAGIVRAFLALAPEKFPRLNEVTLDIRVMAFAAIVSLFAAVLFGAGPALRVSRANLNEILGAAAGGLGTGARARRPLSVIVAAELALAVLLLLVGGVLIRSFVGLTRVDLGFDPTSVLAFDVRPASNARTSAPGGPRLTAADFGQPTALLSGSGKQQALVTEEMERQLVLLPGVVAAGMTSQLPLGGMSGSQDVHVDGRPDAADPMASMIAVNRVSVGYFRAMRLRLRDGRWFDLRDREGAVRVVVVNDAMARKCWPGGAAIGKGLHLGTLPARVVGIVAYSRAAGPQDEPAAEVYAAVLQEPYARPMTWVVKTDGATAGVSGAVVQVMKKVDPGSEVWRTRALEQLLSQIVAIPRLAAFLLGSFSFLALVIALVGVQGVLEYSVAQRVREIGVRLAIGATPRAIVRQVLRQAFVWAGLGLVVGVAGALMLSELLASVLYGVRAVDPVTAVITCVVLFVGVAFAAWRPARHASHIDPMASLRSE